MFKGILIERDDNHYTAAVTELDEATLPEGDVTIEVAYSTLNYKDALAITSKAPVVRRFPMVPGIDLAGTVTASEHPDYSVGDAAIVNGWGIGERHWGGLAQKACVQADWLVPMPAGLTSCQAMAIGTAGYTAMLSVLALERHGVSPECGDILVTGATGGVGSIAVAVLAKLGYRVVAVSGKEDAVAYLKGLGASDVLPREEFTGPCKPLAEERWAGAIDVVGGQTLANVCAGMQYGGVVAACGLAGGMDFPATVAPFILRGVTLAGIDSVMCPKPRRLLAWNRLVCDLDMDKLETITRVIGLSEAIDAAQALLDGRLRGRLVVDPNR